ncbi:ABC transporter ATP-binding protein [Cellulomonas hominis]|uniref:ABC transporter ATP-binding protein n=1 Tax=Cellulomonas hominis TaxID=156981 RepID=UPI0027DEF77E|nr:ABC transporter ATP-binding protein [Cellulomonas hominis]
MTTAAHPIRSQAPGAPAVAARLRAADLTLAYGDRTVVRGLDLVVPEGELTVVVGPNACGKSTVLRALARLLRPSTGTVLLDGRSVRDFGSKELARTLGLLPQTSVAPSGITVADLVTRGRYPHQRLGRQLSRADAEAVARALAATGVTDLAARPVEELSGGQRQRVWVAMVLAQETGTLLLDEPTTFLDITHQYDLLELFVDLHRAGRTVVAVLHDLNQACRYGTHLVAMRDGAVVAQGAPADVVTPAMVREVFGLDAMVVPDPAVGTPMVVPLGRR